MLFYVPGNRISMKHRCVAADSYRLLYCWINIQHAQFYQAYSIDSVKHSIMPVNVSPIDNVFSKHLLHIRFLFHAR